jgi:hypothetical protein
MSKFTTTLFIVLVATTSCIGQELSCAQFTACTTAVRQRVDGCSQNLTSVPNVAFYDCQCRELSSIVTCYTYCPGDTDIQRNLPNEKSNADAWCSQASSMHAAQPTSTTTSDKSTSTTKSSSVPKSSSLILQSSASQTQPSNKPSVTLQTDDTPSVTRTTYGATSTLNIANGGTSVVPPSYPIIALLGWVYWVLGL